MFANISAYTVYVVRHAYNVDSVGTGLLCLFVYLLCYATMQQCSYYLPIMLNIVCSRIRIMPSLLSLFVYKFSLVITDNVERLFY